MDTYTSLSPFEPKARSIGEILWNSTTIYYENFAVLAGASLLLLALPPYIDSVAMEYGLFGDPGLIAQILIGQLISLISVLFEPIAVIVCSLHLLGAKPTFSQTIKQLSAALVLRVLGTYIVMSVFLVFLALAFIVPALIYWIRWALYTAIVVLERRVYLDALRRSRELMEYEWWRYFGMISPLFVIGSLGGVLLFLYEDSGLEETIVSVGFSLVIALINPIFSVASVLFYYDVRMRKEGLTLDAIRELIGLKWGLDEWSLQWDLPNRADRPPTVPD